MDYSQLKNEYESLNSEQKKVVDSPLENLLVFSPAGTGKTKAIALRTASMINQGIKAKEILCLTFTNKAKKEMDDRISSYIDASKNEVTVRTFHGFCHDVIKEEAKTHLDIPRDFIIYDEDDTLEIIKSLTKKNFNLKLLQTFIEEIKKHSLTLPSTTIWKEVVFDFFSKDMEPLLKATKYPIEIEALKKYGHILISKYEKILGEQKGLDFTDLIVKTYRLFENNLILEKWRSRFSVFQIDEVQDTSTREYEIVKKLALGKKLSFFGDINQTIYEWRGSVPEEILEDFNFSFAPVRKIQFEINYRSTKTLLSASTLFLKNCKDVPRVHDIPHNPHQNSIEGDKIYIHESENVYQEGLFIAKMIKEKNMNYSRTAVLSRTNKINQEISLALRDSDVPCFVIDEFKFYRRQEIKDILAIFKLLVNPYDYSSLRRYALRFLTGIGERTISYLESDEVKSLGLRSTDFLNPAIDRFSDLYEPLFKSLESKKAIVFFDVESTGVDVFKDDIIQIGAIKLRKNEDASISEEIFERFLTTNKDLEDSAKVHGFDNSFISKNGESPIVVLEDFKSFIGDSILIGHNLSYDLNIMKSQRARLNLSPLSDNIFFDTLDLSRKFCQDLPNHKLSTLAEFFKVESKADHNALNDIMATKEVFFKLLPKIQETSLGRMSTLLRFKNQFESLRKLIDDLKSTMETYDLCRLTKYILDEFKITDYYFEEIDRMKNIDTFIDICKYKDDENLTTKDKIHKLLTLASLSNSEIDSSGKEENKVAIITVHQAKGLEFDNVFIAGLNQRTFPMTYYGPVSSEEYRLFYVGITRAKKNLYLSYHRQDMNNRYKKPSIFLDMIDSDYTETI